MPSRFTVHAPHSATPQPNLVPFMPRRSRKTHKSGMSGSASTTWELPLMLSVTMLRPASGSCSLAPGSGPRQDSHLHELGEELHEHRLGVDAIVKTGAADLDRARDIVEILPEGEIAVAPGDELMVRDRPQTLPLHD